MPPASIRDVAQHAGVSVGTVSNVLNRPDEVSAESIARVNRAIEALGYVRNDAARKLRAGVSRPGVAASRSSGGPSTSARSTTAWQAHASPPRTRSTSSSRSSRPRP